MGVPGSEEMNSEAFQGLRCLPLTFQEFREQNCVLRESKRGRSQGGYVRSLHCSLNFPTGLNFLNKKSEKPTKTTDIS